MKKFGLSLVFVYWITSVSIGLTQDVRTLYDKVRKEYEAGNFATVVNLCKQIIERCEQNYPDAECRYTDVMKNVYRYKGFSEFRIYTQEQNMDQLEEAINSLTKSYELYGDPEISFNYGYMQSLRAIKLKNGRDLDGLVNAWRGILGIYARDEWTVSNDLLNKLKIFIQQAVEISITPPDSALTTGRFPSFMIRLACDLAQKRTLAREDSIFFNVYYRRAIDDEYNLRGNEWRARGFEAEQIFKANPYDSTYRICRGYLELALRFAKSTQRKAEMLKELTKVALYMEKEGRNSRRETELQYAREKASQAYTILQEHRSDIPRELENEIKKVYGNAIFRLVDYYFSITTSKDRMNSFLTARRIGEELLVPDGQGGLKQKFQWEGYEDLYLKLSDVGYELGDEKFAVDMVDKAWKAVLEINHIQLQQIYGPIPPQTAKELLQFAQVYQQIAERFGLQSVLHWLRPIIKTLSQKSFYTTKGGGY
ncbi:MAG: hypothetical protein ONB31_03930 [candidate division KSB1 bacterium]|nr:hypothetical protein [candidate division KSB1 bacterium]MDZ7333793.1 hypothetical protein [candidate division KSB1 bacterium]MDZ7356036.1 hypothetical protein [candidate division KSB1 bacterium]MDZ7400553.1 hypothetical protein [candidate division KSB1 bacterium]